MMIATHPLADPFSGLPLTAAPGAGLSRLPYAAHDEAALRALLLEAMAQQFPQWNALLAQADGPPDMAVLYAELYAAMAATLDAIAAARVNENYLRTAELPRSWIDLAQLIGYRLAPGAAAATVQAFVLKDGKEGEIPAGFQLALPADKLPSSAADPTAPVYQTQAALAAAALRNRLYLHGHDRSAQQLVFMRQTELQLAATVTGLKANLPALFVTPFRYEAVLLTAVREQPGATWLGWSASGAPPVALQIADTEIHLAPAQVVKHAAAARAAELTLGTRRIPVPRVEVFSVGHAILIESEGFRWGAAVAAIDAGGGKSAGPGDLLIDRPLPQSLPRATTRIYPARELGAVQRLARGADEIVPNSGHGLFNVQPAQNGETVLVLHADGVEQLQVTQAGSSSFYLTEPLGRSFKHRAHLDNPQQRSLRLFGLAGVLSQPVRPLLLRDLLEPNELPYTLDLDRSVDAIGPGSRVAISDGSRTFALRVQRAELAAGRTRLIFASPLPNDLRLDRLHVYGDFKSSARIAGYNRSEEVLAASAAELIVAGHGWQLAAGRWLVLQAPAAAEAVRIAQVQEQQRDDQPVTRIALSRPLTQAYPLADTVIYGNAVPIDHGSTVADEVLGSGDPAAAPQRFLLRRAPLAFVADPAAERGVRAALEVIVDGTRWTEVTTLAASSAADLHYVLELDERERASIVFGDGRRGATPPSGRNNIVARYRVAVGDRMLANGSAQSIVTMPAALPFIDASFNPVAASGGAPREDGAAVKRNARYRVRSLERAVTAEDYAALAASHAGVAQARADWRWDANGPQLRSRRLWITVQAQGGGALNPELKESLTAYLAIRAAPGLRFSLRDALRVPIRLTLDVTASANARRGDVLARLQAAFGREPGGFFHFDRRALGADLFLSEVIASADGVAGVEHLRPLAFHREDAAASIEDRIRLGDDGLASGGDPVDATVGRLRIELSGGYE
jgi:predicted phage baseplate assembly protein